MERTVFLIIFLLFAVIFGKMFCGKVCPFGLLQDWLHKIPFPLKIKTFKGEKILLMLKYALLLSIFIMPFLGNTETTEERSFNFSLSSVIIFVVSLVLFIIIYRPFCKYFCPYGAVLSLFNLISPYRYRIDKEKCISCNKCKKVCKMNVDVHKTPNHLECIRCGKCKKACPTKAIYSGFNCNPKNNPTLAASRYAGLKANVHVCNKTQFCTLINGSEKDIKI